LKPGGRVTVQELLKKRYPPELVDALLNAHKEIEENYSLEKWRATEVDAGQFVEAVRRVIEFELQGKQYTPLDRPISRFNEGVLQQYERADGDESFRMLIPRVLRGVYEVRNKRGGGHLAGVSPNTMDATLVLGNVKWVLAELVRLASGLPPEQRQKLVDDIVERKLDILWKHGEITRVLDTGLTANEQVLVLLYDRAPQTVEELRRTIEYKNPTRFRQLLGKLHDSRLIEVLGDDKCLISPKGVREAEAILKRRRGTTAP
jgi:hypothetical protein